MIIYLYHFRYEYKRLVNCSKNSNSFQYINYILGFPHSKFQLFEKIE